MLPDSGRTACYADSRPVFMHTLLLGMQDQQASGVDCCRLFDIGMNARKGAEGPGLATRSVCAMQYQ